MQSTVSFDCRIGLTWRLGAPCMGPRAGQGSAEDRDGPTWESGSGSAFSIAPFSATAEWIYFGFSASCSSVYCFFDDCDRGNLLAVRNISAVEIFIGGWPLGDIYSGDKNISKSSKKS